MRSKNLILGVIAFASVALVSCQGGAGSKSTKISHDIDTVSYAIGHAVGKNLKNQFPDANPALVAKGIAEAFEGKENKLFKTEMEADQYIRNYMRKEQAKVAMENKAAGEKFLQENKSKSGIVVTPSGLQYEVIKEGNGPKPTADNTVKVNYKGTTIDGEVFDSSEERGKPAEFEVKGVIKGWTEGLQLMSVGSKYKFYIPSDLAYGPRQAGEKIKPNSVLIFEVELLEIVK